jgi:hypothetical protein
VSSQLYVGPNPADDDSMLSRLQADAILGAGRAYVDAQVASQAAAYASKAYIDTADAGYADIAYYQNRDALNVHLSDRGIPGGVAGLDSTGKIPPIQVPALGSGIIHGPWGLTTAYSGVTGSTPVKVAETTIGVTGWNFRPLVFLVAQVDVSAFGRPVIEVRIGSPANTTYASQTLVAQGSGRAVYDDTQVVVINPGAAPGAMSDGIQTYYQPNLDARLSVWLYSDEPRTGQVSMSGSSIWTGSAWIVRVS